jgi:putative addiction module killer protein
MYTVKTLPEFTNWLAGLKVGSVRGAVAARIKRLALGLGLGLGLAGDVAPVGDGLSELRIHLGAGWRVYFVQHGQTVVVLLCVGAKRTQAKDIRRAKTLAALLD